jgi:putative spermidine/putrescine transport system ATP-binding protein
MAKSAGMTATAPKPAKLVVEGLCKRYGATTALEPSSLSVAEGEFLTLLGPSGSGKTTLLQLICGLVEASEGKVVIDGRDQSSTPVHQRDIGLVFQHYALFPHLTVSENIAFPLKMRGRSASEIESRVSATLAMVHLGHLANRFPRELSGGQQQRVALARCFVYQPSIILMDEPLGALDKKLREHMQIEIKRLHRESGATIVYVTHDQEEALAMSDRICLMNHAKIEQLGAPREIYEKPRTAFAADFIGISNIFRGRWDGNGAIETAHGRFNLPTGAAPAQVENALVVRPEHLRIGARDGNAISGKVSEIVYAGSETRVIATLADGAQLVLRLGSDEAVPQIDEVIVAGWARDKAVLVA